MERIKQAIEKVKAQQSNEAGLSARRMTSDARLGATSVFRESQVHEEVENISYMNTRVVKLQEEHLKKNRIVAFDKSDPKSLSFDLLRTHVLQKMEENGWRTLAITSPTPESGKSVIAINLTMSIAQQTNKTSMLVDFDLRRPKIGTYLGISMEKSLNQLLDGSAELPDVLVNPGISRMVVLPTKHPVRKSSETLSSKQIANLIKELRERYASRIVIFDLPPVLVADDVMALMPHIDCVLMVVANGMSTRKEIEDSLRIIPATKLLGTILNKAEIETMPYYYY
jgi:capsular exopolysaccharide synthesis family protein